MRVASTLTATVTSLLLASAIQMVRAGDCIDQNPLAHADLDFTPSGVILEADGFDFLLVGTEMFLHTRHPSTLSHIDNSSTIGGREGVLVPWDDGSSHAFTVWGTAYVSESVIEPDGSLLADPLWTHNLASCPEDRMEATPVVHMYDRASDSFRTAYADGLVFVASSIPQECSGPPNFVLGIEVETATPRFQFESNASEILGAVRGLSIDPFLDLLFVGADNSITPSASLFALDLITATSTWAVDAGRLWGPAVIRNDVLYTAGGTQLSAWNPADGSPRWSVSVPSGAPIRADVIAPFVPPYHDAIIVRDFLGRVHLARDDGASATWEWTAVVPDGVGGPYLLAFDPVAGAVYAPDQVGRVHVIDAEAGAIVSATGIDSTGSNASALAVRWPLADGEDVELLVGTEEGDVSRLCVAQTDILRNGLGPLSRGESEIGVSSYHDTDTDDVSLVVHLLDQVTESTVLTRFEVVATGLGPCDQGRGPTPCFEMMEFDLMAWPPGVPVSGDVSSPSSPGKLFHVDVTDRLTIVRGHGVVRVTDVLTSPTLLSFDLSGLDLEIPPAIPPEGPRIALLGRGSASGAGRLMFGFGAGPEADEQYDPGPPENHVPIPQTTVRVRGEATPALGVPGAAPGSPLLIATPSPFRTDTTVRFQSRADVEIRMTVYDVTGRRIATLFEGRGTGHERQVAWDAAELAPGHYFVELVAGNDVTVREVVRLE